MIRRSVAGPIPSRQALVEDRRYAVDYYADRICRSLGNKLEVFASFPSPTEFHHRYSVFAATSLSLLYQEEGLLDSGISEDDQTYPLRRLREYIRDNLEPTWPTLARAVVATLPPLPEEVTMFYQGRS